LAAVCLIYAAWIAVFEQTYVYQAAPLASEIYWSFNRPIQQILPRLEMQVIVVAPFAAIALLKRDSFGMIVAFAWLGFAASYLVQQKGYGYHLLPAVVATLLLAASVLSNSVVTQPVRFAASAL